VTINRIPDSQITNGSRPIAFFNLDLPKTAVSLAKSIVLFGEGRATHSSGPKRIKVSDLIRSHF